jgi:hypothetical protein
MLHENSQRLIDEWRRQRPGAGRLPNRTAMSPIGFGALLSQLFILGWEPGALPRFRLVGGQVASVHGHDLRDAPLAPLWRREDRDLLLQRIDEARRDGRALALQASATTVSGEELNLEIVMAPLQGPDGQADRMIGLYQLLAPRPLVCGRPVSQLQLRSARILGEGAEAAGPDNPRTRHLRLVVDNGCRVA